ncbi:MAG TPA: hypothetical protein VHV57_07005 [Acidimicrobiales bacterium]|jgi:hypothetical protein|nr:hypothetical protein [Acidimicrobiales bacterium]
MGEFRTIDELAAQVGHFCWLEHRIFELTGAWASEPAPDVAAINVFFHTASMVHGGLAVEWRGHLPVRAAIDPDAFVVPPPAPAAAVMADLAGAADQVTRLSGLVGVVLPRLLATYSADLVQASPVSEAPVRALLALAAFSGQSELERGNRLLQSALQIAEQPGKVREFGQALERSLNDTIGIFPSAWAS